jgi:hypothetical protein
MRYSTPNISKISRRLSKVFLLHHQLSVLDLSNNLLQDLLCKFYNGEPNVEEVTVQTNPVS